jgi:hypothetical protein
MLFVPIEVSESLHHWVVSKCYHPQKKWQLHQSW